MVEEKIGGNHVITDGEFERPGAIEVPASRPKPTERFVVEMEGSLAILKRYLDNIYYFGINYPKPPRHKEALEALENLAKHVAQLKQM